MESKTIRVRIAADKLRDILAVAYSDGALNSEEYLEVVQTLKQKVCLGAELLELVDEIKTELTDARKFGLSYTNRRSS